jgi:hypothetical protein
MTIMLTATCHCGAVKVQAPRKPRSLTDCNCSICHRYGVRWAYYKDADVQLVAADDATDDYVWGDKTQKFIRCRMCGCVMQWKKFEVGKDTYTGVNARNFEPAAVASVKVRLLDGANTWKYIA